MKTEFRGLGLVVCLFLSLILVAGADKSNKYSKKANLAESEKYDSDFR
jgi:hypothetical protein